MKVRTIGDGLVRMEHGLALVELVKGPVCPPAWEWRAWLDGEFVGGAECGPSLAGAEADAAEWLARAAADLGEARDYLAALAKMGKGGEG